MGAALSIVILFTVTSTIVRIAGVVLEHSGVPRQISRFQAVSALTGAGFTTSESELLLQTPERRKVVIALMITGSIGLASLIATVVVGFTEVGLNAIAIREFAATRGQERRDGLADALGLRIALSVVGVGVATGAAALAGYPGTLVLGAALASIGLGLGSVQLMLSVALQGSLRFGLATIGDLIRQHIRGIGHHHLAPAHVTRVDMVVTDAMAGDDLEIGQMRHLLGPEGAMAAEAGDHAPDLRADLLQQGLRVRRLPELVQREGILDQP